MSILIRLAFLTQIAWSGPGLVIGNSGDGLPYPHGRIVLRDLVENGLEKKALIGHAADAVLSTNINSLRDLPLTNSEKMILAVKLTDLNRITPRLGDALYLAIQSLSWFLVTSPLAPVPTREDGGILESDVLGKRLQIANRLNSTVRISKNRFAKMDSLSRVALVLHEAVSSILKPRCNFLKTECYQDANKARELIGLFFSDKLNQLSESQKLNINENIQAPELSTIYGPRFPSIQLTETNGIEAAQALKTTVILPGIPAADANTSFYKICNRAARSEFNHVNAIFESGSMQSKFLEMNRNSLLSPVSENYLSIEAIPSKEMAISMPSKGSGVACFRMLTSAFEHIKLAFYGDAGPIEEGASGIVMNGSLMSYKFPATGKSAFTPILYNLVVDGSDEKALADCRERSTLLVGSPIADCKKGGACGICGFPSKTCKSSEPEKIGSCVMAAPRFEWGGSLAAAINLRQENIIRDRNRADALIRNLYAKKLKRSPDELGYYWWLNSYLRGEMPYPKLNAYFARAAVPLKSDNLISSMRPSSSIGSTIKDLEINRRDVLK